MIRALGEVVLCLIEVGLGSTLEEFEDVIDPVQAGRHQMCRGTHKEREKGLMRGDARTMLLTLFHEDYCCERRGFTSNRLRSGIISDNGHIQASQPVATAD